MTRINDPVVVAEIEALHKEYEAALVGNDIAKLTEFFWDSPLSVRLGVRENLYGSEEIEAFRKARPAFNLSRDIFNVKIVTFGDDCAIVTLEFRRSQFSGPPKGRQGQVWRRFPEGWKIVSAHVSLMYDTYADQAAALIGLQIPPALREGVIQNIERSSRIAASLLDSPLTEETVSAPRFEP